MYLSIKFLLLFSETHNCTDFVYFVCSKLLYVLGVQISHHLVWNGYTKRVKETDLYVQTLDIKLLQNKYSKYYSENGIISDMKLNFESLAVSLRTTRFNTQKFYMVLALHSVFRTYLRTDSVHH